MSRFVRAEVRQLRAYSLDLSPCRFKLDQNEVPWELPRRIKEEVARRLVARDWARYPDFHAERLRQRLAASHGVAPEAVLVGNGSNELLAATLAAVGGPGREILGLAPSFSLYPVFALQSGARYRAVGPRSDLALPIEELEREIDLDPSRPVLVASPNNPTGEAIAPETIERWAAKLAAANAPLLVDNAYGEFCRHDYRPLLARHENLVLFRTFSKAWSLAGLRLGYLLAAPELTAEILKVKLPYNLGQAAAIAGELALENSPLVGRRVQLLLARREQWRVLLAASQDEVFASEANFLLVRNGKEKSLLVKGLLAERGIRVRDVSGGPGLEGCLRFSVGTGQALREVERALAEVFSLTGSLSLREQR
ncbi:MAG: histidinol-phosphate transaminase [Thermoanaerobaculia bacterium]